MHEFKEPRGNFNFWDCHTAHYPRMYWSWQCDRGRVFTWGSVFPSRAGCTQSFLSIRWQWMPDPPLADLQCKAHRRRCCAPSLLLVALQGSSLEKRFLCLSLLINAIEEEQPVLLCGSLAQGAASSATAHGCTVLGREPGGLLSLMNLVTPASSYDSRLPPTTTGTKLFKNLFTQPRKVSKQYTQLQMESTCMLSQVYDMERICFLFWFY